MIEKLLLVDEKITVAVNSLSGGILDYPMDALALVTRFHWFILIAGLPILFFAKEQKFKKLLIFMFPLYVLHLIVGLAKEYFARPRPFDNEALAIHLVNYFGTPASFSFPSGHATIIFAAAVVLTYLAKGKAWLFYALAFLVAFGRLYLGVHYFSDVLVGGLLGWGFTTLSLYFYKKSSEVIL